MRTRPALSAAAIIAAACSSPTAMGFSVTTCLPAASAASTCSVWRCVGVATKTTSTRSLSAISSTRGKQRACGKSAPNRARTDSSLSAAAARLKAGLLRTGWINAEPALPRPAIPKRSGWAEGMSAFDVAPFVLAVAIGFSRHQALQAALSQRRFEFLPDEGLLVGIFDLVLRRARLGEGPRRMQGQIARRCVSDIEMLVVPVVGGNEDAALAPRHDHLLAAFRPHD